MTEEGGWKRRMPSNRLSDLREMGSVPVVPVSGHEVPFHGADPNAPGPGEPVGQNHDDLVGVGVDHLVSFVLELPDLFCNRHVCSLEGVPSVLCTHVCSEPAYSQADF